MEPSLPTDNTITVYVAGVRVLDRTTGTTDYEIAVHDPATGRTGGVLFRDRGISFMDLMVRKIGTPISVPDHDIAWSNMEST